MSDENNEHEGVLLEDGLSISDLLNGGGCFNINSNFAHDAGDPSDFNLFPELETGADLDEDGAPLHEAIPSPWLLAFEDLRRQMRPLPAPNGQIYKRIVRDGRHPLPTTTTDAVGDAQTHATSQHIRLTIHYNFYLEQSEQPFDSTYLRTKPLVFISGQQSTLAGIEIACLSMMVGEEAQFVIPYSLLYGELGCAPRIPPRADGLLVIHLLRADDVGDADALDRLADADRRRYAVVMPQARSVYRRGRDAFQRRDYALASRMFHRAVAALEVCTMSDAAEAEDQQRMVCMLYTNLAVCYNKLALPKRACLMATEVERLQRGVKGGPSGKALFHHGRALLQLGDFGRAEEKLLQAQRVEPANAEVTAELKLLARKKEEHRRGERELWRRALGMKERVEAEQAKQKEAEPVDGMDEAFRAMTVKCLKEFEGNEEARTLQLPTGLTAAEVRCVEQMIADMRIRLEVRGGGPAVCGGAQKMGQQQQKTYTLRKVEAAE